MPQGKFRKTINRIVRLLVRAVAGLLLFFLLLIILLQFPLVQTFLAVRAADWLSGRTGAVIEIERVAMRIPRSVELTGIYIEDPEGDTLVYAGNIYAELSMFGLLRNRIHVDLLEIDDLTAFVLRESPDTVFNFQFLADVFADNDLQEAPEAGGENLQMPGNAYSPGDTSAGDNQEATGENENGMSLHLGRVNLNDIVIHFNDHFSGTRLDAIIGEFQSNLDRSDLLNGQYHAGRTTLTNSSVELFSYEPTFPEEEPDTEPGPVGVSLASLNITDSRFVSDDYEGGRISIETSSLEITPRSISLDDLYADIASLVTDNLNASIIIPRTEENGEEEPEATVSDGFRFSDIMEWTVGLGNLEIRNSFITIVEEDTPVAADTFDPQNFSLGSLNMDARNIFVAPDSLTLDLFNMNMLVSEALILDRLELRVDMGRGSGTVDLSMETGESRANLNTRIEANLLDFMTEDLYNRYMFLEIRDARINEDLVFLVPDLGPYYFNWQEDGIILADIRMNGSPAHMVVENFQLEGRGAISAFAEGEVMGLPFADSLFIDMEEFRLWAAPGLIYANVPDLQQPEGITIPDSVMVQGQFRGSTNEFETGLTVYGSDIGEATIMLALEGEPGYETFEGRVFSGSFDIGRLLQEDILQQPVSIELGFHGLGLDPETMDMNAWLAIGRLMIMDYRYDAIVLDLALRDSTVSLFTTYKDDVLSAEIDAAMGLFREKMTVLGSIAVEYADLEQLGFSEEEMMAGITIETDIIQYPEDFFSGSILISDANFAINDQIHNIPDIQIISDSSPGNYSMELISEFLHTDYRGNISPAGIPDAFTGHLVNYFPVPELTGEDYETTEEITGGTETTQEITEAAGTTEEITGKTETAEEITGKAPMESPGEELFSLNLHLFPSELVMNLLPGLEEYDTLSLHLDYDSRINQLALDVLMESSVYSGIDLHNFHARVLSDRQKMDFGMFLDSINLNETALTGFDISGTFAGQMLDVSFSVYDEIEQQILMIGARAEIEDELYHIRIDPDNLVLTYQDWDIHPDNLIVLGDERLRFHNFLLEHEESMLSVDSRDTEEYDDVLDISIRQFDLSSLTGFAEPFIPLGGGLVDGDVTLRNLAGVSSFTADVTLRELVWNQYMIETIRLHAEDAGPRELSIEAFLEHEETSVSISGSYFPGEEAAVDLQLDIDRLDLQIAQMFTGEEITHLDGVVTGRIHAAGTLPEPEITGQLNIRDAAFRITQLNAGYFIPEEQIMFDRHNIRLQDFVLEDSLGRTASINGSVNIQDLENIALNIDFSTRNFTLMNLQRRGGDMFYGRILMDSDLSLRGMHHSPAIDGRLRLNEGSTFTFIVPQTTPEAIGGEGVVEFISPDEEEFYRRVVDRFETDEIRSQLDMMTINLNIELDRETVLRVIIDEVAGDFLELQGGAVLTFGIDPGGIISLVGRYEIVEGEYMLSFHEVARRRFLITEGSSIMFTGDPMEAEIDITARHIVRTGVNELMRPLGGGDQPRGEVIRRQYPFHVYLNMQGELMSPDISFELDMPPEHRGAMDGAIMTRVNSINRDESELNKQVFALLILGNFIHENPFAAEGPGISTTARRSASQIMSQQLNRLSDRYVRGVNISFELESYEVDRAEDDAVGRTELQVEISRDFFDDRVRVAVGGHIELEDETHRERGAGDIAGDFSLEYLLTPEGDLLLRGFRQREYGDLIDGQITKTGVSFIFSRSYNRFREVFRREARDVPLLPVIETDPSVTGETGDDIIIED